MYPAFVLNNQNCKVTCFNSKEKTEFLYNIYKNIGRKYRDSDLKIKTDNCTAMFESSYIIDPQGNLYKCWADIGQTDLKIGTLNEGITNYDLVCKYMMNSDKFSDEKCLKCRIFPICNGGCSRYRFGDLHKTDDICPIHEDNILNFAL